MIIEQKYEVVGKLQPVEVGIVNNVPLFSTISTVYMCVGCGCVVVGRTEHNIWHSKTRSSV